MQWKSFLLKESDKLVNERDQLVADVTGDLGSAVALVHLNQKYQNEAVEELVLNTNDMKKIIEYKSKFVRKDTPIFQISDSNIGRSQFFSASKYIGNLEINTVLFNVMVLWLMTLILYISLVDNCLKKLIDILS